MIDKIKEIEKRFLEVADIDIDMSIYPIKQTENTQVKTNKEKSNEFSEVFTPLWLVDKMIEIPDDFNWKDKSKITMDLCAGYGQFTIRMLRKKYSVLGEDFDIDKFLNNTHYINELQKISCFKLLYIFGTDINLLIGDARKLPELDDNTNGIWEYIIDDISGIGQWVNVTLMYKSIINKYNTYNKLKKYMEKL